MSDEQLLKSKLDATHFSEEVKNHMIKWYNFQKDEYYNVDQYIDSYNPNFDINLFGKYNEEEVELHNILFSIDEKLVDLFKIINKDEILTSSTCQYNAKGYSFFSFPAPNFYFWCKKLSRYAMKYIEDNNLYQVDKYKDLDLSYRYTDEETINNLKKEYAIVDEAMNLPIVKRFCENGRKRNDRKNIIRFSYCWFEGETSITPSVQWLFLQEDIPEIVESLKTIYFEM